ncbi:unnamed protein product [Ixodes hexagonus]
MHVLLADISYGYIVEQQPIGRLLFRQYCQTKPHYCKCNGFLDAVDVYELQLDEDRALAAQDVFNKYLSEQSSEFVDVVNEELLERCKQGLAEASKDLFAECAKAVKDFLTGGPFHEFEGSLYFDRYLQWKWLEGQPVTAKTFRMYRVLGKGGFGEVCACQVRATGKMYACKKLEKKRIKKRRGGDDGAHREADPAEGQLSLCGEPSVRLRDEGRPVPGADHHERRRPQVPHVLYGWGAWV